MTERTKKLILTIDDDAATRRYFKTILEESNYKVIEAVNAQKGIEVFKKENPDLVLLDLRMPGMGGLDALKHFTENYPDTPVIVASATDSIDDVVESLRIGAWDFVLKPMHSYDILLHQTQKALERSTLRKQNAEYQDLLLEAVNKLKMELESGKNIQMKLLPEDKNKFGEYKFESMVLPSLYLSGDFVDYFKINENFSAFYIADISGHGVSSALVTVFLKSFMNNAKEEFSQNHKKHILEPAVLLDPPERQTVSDVGSGCNRNEHRTASGVHASICNRPSLKRSVPVSARGMKPLAVRNASYPLNLHIVKQRSILPRVQE